MVDRSQRDFLDPDILTRLGNLTLHARIPMLGNVSGKHKSPHRGSSVEFAEYRKYVPGDDTRRLDWRAYARSDRFYIKEFEADTNLRLCLVIDGSGSMRYEGEVGVSKLAFAKQIAGTLAMLAARQGDAVGLTCAAPEVHQEIQPRRSAAHLKHVLDALGNMEARGETGLVEALHALSEKTAQRALIVVISDLFVEPAELGQALQHLRFRKHDVAVFHLLEEAELSFEFDRPIRFIDLEGGTPVLADPSVVRVQYLKALTEYVEQLDTEVRDAAVDYHRIRLDQPVGDVLARFLLGRTPKRARR